MIEWVPVAGVEPWWIGQMDTPVGQLWVIYSDQGLIAAEFGPEQPTRFSGRDLIAQQLPSWVKDLFAQAFAGQIIKPWPAMNIGFSPLEQALISTATQIPFGHTCSYGTLAQWAGHPGRARAAGRAMSRAPIAYLVPTHRVIHANGTPAPCQQDGLSQALRCYEHITLGRFTRATDA